jgi:hypothetical protein
VLDVGDTLDLAVDPRSDAFFDSSLFTATVELLDRTPVASCRSVTVAAGEGCTATASIDDGSFDPDGESVTVTQSPVGPYGLGSTNVTLTVTDAAGLSDSCTATVTVVDETPPAITSIAVTPDELWPPNHRMVPVTVIVSAHDDCDPAPHAAIVSVSCNETADARGAGSTEPDFEISGPLTADLRAERSGPGSGRIYTISVRVTDADGNTATGTVTVTVPSNQRKQET